MADQINLAEPQASSQPALVGGTSHLSAQALPKDNTELQYPSLKDVFQDNQSLWQSVFGPYIGKSRMPLFSVFRKKITVGKDSNVQIPEGEEVGLQILFLKCDGNRFARNAHANQLEIQCSTYFYGPLVVVYGELSPPYKLFDFDYKFLSEAIQPLNEEEQKIYPLPFNAKKCTTVKNLMADSRFVQPLEVLQQQMSHEQFMLYFYKTSFCPMINKKHEWAECPYAHRQQDFRRPPHLYFYYTEKCPHVAEDGSWDQCPHYLECEYSHTLVEQLFSPLNYKLKQCPDRSPDQKFQCKKRHDVCCHNHSQEEKDLALNALRQPPMALNFDHDSMLDYIELIDQQGLLHNVQDDSFLIEDRFSNQLKKVQACKTAPTLGGLKKAPMTSQFSQDAKPFIPSFMPKPVSELPSFIPKQPACCGHSHAQPAAEEKP